MACGHAERQTIPVLQFANVTRLRILTSCSPTPLFLFEETFQGQVYGCMVGRSKFRQIGTRNYSAVHGTVRTVLSCQHVHVDKRSSLVHNKKYIRRLTAAFARTMHIVVNRRKLQVTVQAHNASPADRPLIAQSMGRVRTLLPGATAGKLQPAPGPCPVR